MINSAFSQVLCLCYVSDFGHDYEEVYLGWKGVNEEDSPEGLMTGENVCLVLENNNFSVAVANAWYLFLSTIVQ